MFERIMVPLDGSPLAESALPLAGIVARAASAEVVVLRAVQAAPHFDVDREAEAQVKVVEEAERYLNEIARRDELRDLDVTTSVPYGDAAEMIVDQATARDVDLIVMATHGRTGLARLAFGSVTDRMLHTFDRSLLIIRPTERPEGPAYAQPPVRIVVPLDGSSRAEQVIDVAAELARRMGAEICLVTVLPPPDGVELAEGRLGIPIEEKIEQARARAEQYLAAIADRLTVEGLTAQVLVRVGDPAPEIESIAEQVPRSIIVMSTHGRSTVGRWIYGSVADHLIRRAKVPVLIQRVAETSGDSRQGIVESVR